MSNRLIFCIGAFHSLPVQSGVRDAVPGNYPEASRVQPGIT